MPNFTPQNPAWLSSPAPGSSYPYSTGLIQPGGTSFSKAAGIRPRAAVPAPAPVQGGYIQPNPVQSAAPPSNYLDAQAAQQAYQNRVDRMRAGFPGDYSAAPTNQFMDWGRQQALQNPVMAQRMAQMAQAAQAQGQNPQR